MFNYGTPGLDYGYMTMDSGNMFGGKSENLIKRVNRLKLQESLRKDYCSKHGMPYKPLKIGAFVHSLDKRYSDGTFIVSHNGTKMPATPISSVRELIRIVEQKQYNVIAIDEVQFFQEKERDGSWSIVKAIHHLLQNHKFVLVAGLEKDFRGLPFGPTGDLMAISDEKKSHISICTVCGGAAILPQRFVNGEPAFEDDDVIVVGAKEAYEPRCRMHHNVQIRQQVTELKGIL